MAALMLDLDEEEVICLPKQIETAAMQQKCVLLIEDSEEAMLLVRFALEEYGQGVYRLEWASNLGEGLDFLSVGQIDVVLLDLGLPDSSGPESFAWVREIAPHVPVVVLTGDAKAETERAITAGGVEGYLVKDLVSAADVVETLRDALLAGKRKKEQRDQKGRSVLSSPFRIRS